MPEYTPPFTIYWSTFYNAPHDENVDRTHLWQNVEAIYNIIRNSDLEITDSAIYGIISASWAVAGLNPARIKENYFVINQELKLYANGIGLWLDSIIDENYQGFQQTEILINNIKNKRHYTQYVDAAALPPVITPSLSAFLDSDDNPDLAWYWVINYTHYKYDMPTNILTETYREFCHKTYDGIKEYIETYPRRLNPAAIAIFKKKKKRWWK